MRNLLLAACTFGLVIGTAFSAQAQSAPSIDLAADIKGLVHELRAAASRSPQCKVERKRRDAIHGPTINERSPWREIDAERARERKGERERQEAILGPAINERSPWREIDAKRARERKDERERQEGLFGR